jgi:hypothetical protein
MMKKTKMNFTALHNKEYQATVVTICISTWEESSLSLLLWSCLLRAETSLHGPTLTAVLYLWNLFVTIMGVHN